MEHNTVTVWPVKTEPVGKTSALVVVVVLCIALSLWAGQSVLWGLFAISVFAVALAPYFAPTVYSVTDHTLVLRRFWGEKSIPLTRFKAVRRNKYGIWLLTGTKPTAFDSFRQVYIALAASETHDAFAAILERRLLGLDPPAEG